MYLFLDRISYQPEGAEATVLDKVSLYAKSGQIVSVVGRRGPVSRPCCGSWASDPTGATACSRGRTAILSGSRASPCPGLFADGGSTFPTTCSRPSGARRNGAAFRSDAMRFRTWRSTVRIVNRRARGDVLVGGGLAER